MSAIGSYKLIVSLVRETIRGGYATRFSTIEIDAADWLDRQGAHLLVRRAGPREYIISPRVRR